MKVLSAECWVLGAFVAIAIGGCKADEPPTPWEIIHGTAELTASKSLHPNTGAVLGDFPTRTGSLVVADDSTVTGWILLTLLGDTTYVTGSVAPAVGGWILELNGLTPTEYAVVTDGDFPNTYGLFSTASVSGGDVVALHKVYWEFER